jgi:hypothetical protein
VNSHFLPRPHLLNSNNTMLLLSHLVSLLPFSSLAIRLGYLRLSKTINVKVTTLSRRATTRMLGARSRVGSICVAQGRNRWELPRIPARRPLPLDWRWTARVAGPLSTSLAGTNQGSKFRLQFRPKELHTHKIPNLQETRPECRYAHKMQAHEIQAPSDAPPIRCPPHAPKPRKRFLGHGLA